MLPVLRVALDSELAGVSGVYIHRFARTEPPHEQATDPRVRAALVQWINAVLSDVGVEIYSAPTGAGRPGRAGL